MAYNDKSIQMQQIQEPYQAPRGEIIPLSKHNNILVSFSAEGEFEDFTEGGDL